MKNKTFFQRDKLVIDGETFSAGPNNNLEDTNKLVDVRSSCEKVDDNATIFLGSHSPFSNLYSASVRVENTEYSCNEQFIQCAKAAIFDDDESQARILRETNPYKMKKLGSKVKNFKLDKWHKQAKKLAYKVNLAKYSQNDTLKGLLLSTSDKMIAESSEDILGDWIVLT